METLKEKLEEFGIKYIQNLDEFTEKILDFSNIEKAKQERTDIPNKPEIKTNRKSIVIFDNHDFNETYVIDIVNAVLKYLHRDDCEFKNSQTNEIIKTNGAKLLSIDEIDIYYVNDWITRLKTFNPKLLNILQSIFELKSLTENNIKKIEKYHIVPSLMFFNPQIEDCNINCIFEQSLAQISEDAVLSMFYTLKDENVLEYLNVGEKNIES